MVNGTQDNPQEAQEVENVTSKKGGEARDETEITAPPPQDLVGA